MFLASRSNTHSLPSFNIRAHVLGTTCLLLAHATVGLAYFYPPSRRRQDLEKTRSVALAPHLLRTRRCQNDFNSIPVRSRLGKGPAAYQWPSTRGYWTAEIGGVGRGWSLLPRGEPQSQMGIAVQDENRFGTMETMETMETIGMLAVLESTLREKITPASLHVRTSAMATMYFACNRTGPCPARIGKRCASRYPQSSAHQVVQPLANANSLCGGRQ
jgi:hypothetical protein